MRQHAATYNAVALSMLDGSHPRSIARLSGMALKTLTSAALETATENYYEEIAHAF